VVGYDYTVLAGETDGLHAFGLDHMTFRQMGKLSDWFPSSGWWPARASRATPRCWGCAT
jgi:hypothetical protein